MSLEKLYRKYAGSPIRPPAPSEDFEFDIPSLGEAPVIKELSEKEMEDWDNFIAQQNEIKKSLKDLDITKEIVDIGSEEKAGIEEGTIPAIPGKKAKFTPDTLLKMCSKYHDLCYKF